MDDQTKDKMANLLRSLGFQIPDQQPNVLTKFAGIVRENIGDPYIPQPMEMGLNEFGFFLFQWGRYLKVRNPADDMLQLAHQQLLDLQ